MQHYTRTEVARILGIGERRLSYWERIRLVQPQARRGQPFYDFRDLVTLKTIHQLTSEGIPARRLRKAVAALGHQPGTTPAPLSELRVVSNGREVAVFSPAADNPIEPLSGQYVLNFETRELVGNVRKMASRTAEEWFELGLASDSSPDTWPQAVDAYQRALEVSPDWLEARVNLGATLYQMGCMDQAEESFRAALDADPQNATVHFNLGCVLDELGRLLEAGAHLRRAVQLQPHYADAHFNLALVCEKRGEARAARQHWAAYLRLEPRGAWADYARARLIRRKPSSSPEPTPFAI